SAQAIAGWAGIGARAFGSDLDPAQHVKLRNRAATGADLDHVDDRNAQWQPAAGQEAAHACDLHRAAVTRLIGIKEDDFGRGAAHVQRNRLRSAKLLGEMLAEDGP